MRTSSAHEQPISACSCPHQSAFYTRTTSISAKTKFDEQPHRISNSESCITSRVSGICAVHAHLGASCASEPQRKAHCDAPAADVIPLELTSTVPRNPVTPVMSQVLPRMKPSMLSSSSDRDRADGELNWWPFVFAMCPFTVDSSETFLLAGPGARLQNRACSDASDPIAAGLCWCACAGGSRFTKWAENDADSRPCPTARRQSERCIV